MKRVSELPEGRVGAFHVRVIGDLNDQTSPPTIAVEDAVGSAMTIHFSSLFDISQISWKADEWYQLKNFIHFNGENKKERACPDCSEQLSVADADLQHAVEFANTIDAENTLIATKKSEVSHLEQNWLTAVDNVDVLPILWHCDNCDWSSTEVNSNTNTEDVAEGTLVDRISSSIRETTNKRPSRNSNIWRANTDQPSFRDQIRKKQVPDPEKIFYEDIVAEYTFESEIRDPTRIDSIAPTIETAISTHPVTGTTELYCNIKTNSKVFDWSRNRPRLNLVIALDVSGSMGAPLTGDQSSNESTNTYPRIRAIVTELSSFVKRLSETDTIGIVVFNEDSRIVRPLSAASQSSARHLKSRLLSITPEGNTDLIGGHKQAGKILAEETVDDSPAVENRVLLISDTIPSEQGFSEASFIQQCNTFQEQGIATSIISLCGGTSQTQRSLCSVPASNSSFVTQEDELKELFRTGVDSLLFPTAKDFAITTNAPENVLAVGAPSDKPEDTDILHRQTIFPEGPTVQSLEGALFQLTPEALSENLELQITWEDRSGERHSCSNEISWTGPEEAFDSNNIRTKVALYRYQQLLQVWALSQNDNQQILDAKSDRIGDTMGKTISKVRDIYNMKEYLQSELEVTGKKALREEIDILDVLAKMA